MTMEQRDRLRDLQDAAIRKIEGMGVTEEAIIHRDPATHEPITLNDLRSTLYPRIEDKLRDFLAYTA